MGHPGEGHWQLAFNRILRGSSEDDSRKLSISETSIGRGCSGGPLFDQELRLIGMITGISPTFAVATKIDAIQFLLGEWGIPSNQIGTDAVNKERPDLWIPAQDRYEQGPPYAVGQTVKWTFTIKNLGDAEAEPSHVTFGLGRPGSPSWRKLETKIVPAIPPGESKEISLTYEFQKEDLGIRVFYVKVDTQNQIVEMNEKDNIHATDPFWVGPVRNEKVSVGVLGFENRMNAEKRAAGEGLKRALTDWMIAKLSQVEQLALVERAAIDIILEAVESGDINTIEEQDGREISVDDAIIREGAIRNLGTLVAADYLVLGSFSQFPDGFGPPDGLRLHAQIINANTGMVDSTKVTEGKIDELREMIDELAEDTLRAIKAQEPRLRDLKKGDQ